MNRNKKPQEQTDHSTEDKYYPFAFSPLLIILMIAALLLCAAGFVLTTWRLIGAISEKTADVYSWAQSLILYFVSAFLSALIISMFIRSRYTLTKDKLILTFGFIKTAYLIKDIFSVHLFQGKNKLAVYFDDFRTKYTVIVVNPEWYDDFAQELLKRKPSIGFSFSTKEEEDEFQKRQ